MEPFKTFTALAALMNRVNVDTDQIIPKQFLISVERGNMGKNAFYDWRYLDGDDYRPNPEFELNLPRYQGAQPGVMSARRRGMLQTHARPFEVAYESPQGTLRQIAGETGGSFWQTQDVGEGLTRAMAIEQGRYLLGAPARWQSPITMGAVLLQGRQLERFAAGEPGSRDRIFPGTSR